MATTITLRPGVGEIAALLDEARARTIRLISTVSDEDLVRQHDPLMSPLMWDLGHIAHFEELWLTQNLDGQIQFSEMPGMYNPFENPRRVRGELRYPTRDECIGLMHAIRQRVRDKLDTVDFDGSNPLLHDAYVYHMVAQHENQHNETMLQTLQLKQGRPYAAPRGWDLPGAQLTIPRGAMIDVPEGRYAVGTDDRSLSYDNERPCHQVTVRAYRIDVAPVRSAEFEAFIDDGGYQKRALWSEAGWLWLADSGARAPRHWQHLGDGWYEQVMDRVRPIDPERPVCHVCYYEAEAYARWVGKRLPSELEWEVAASWDPAAGRRLRHPWGDAAATPALANVDQLSFDTAPIGAYPANLSPLGMYGAIGDVWEWTSSDFHGYPGFAAFPYPEYSETFFGNEYKVLRGGSWATRPGALRATFRNWDYPIRRQIFSGFRCAADV